MSMRFGVLILAGLFSYCSHVFAGFAPSEWDRYCRKCHVDNPINARYDSSIKAHKNVSISCVACHRDKGIGGHVKASAANILLFFQDMTLPPDVRPQTISSMSSEDCLACHPYILEVDAISPRRLPDAVRSIRLRAAHGQHWEYRSYTPDQREKLKVLMERNATSPLGNAERAQISRLSQIEKMQCSHCHERFRADAPGGIDLKVNIAMKNPMECIACHVALRNSIHPGDNSPLPSAVSCERCHHGKLHQKMFFFPVDCGTQEECLRCHPEYSPGKIAGINPGEFVHKSTGVLDPGPAKKAISSLSNNQKSDRKVSGMNKSSGAIFPLPTQIIRK
jgi:hypothetical protein